MKIGLIGLGKMGIPLAYNAKDQGFEIHVFSNTPEKISSMTAEGIHAFDNLESFINSLGSPRIVWLMIPSGDPVDHLLEKLVPLLSPEDIIIDGGNSYYKDSQQRYHMLKKHHIHFLDVGTSGGIEGARKGACMMIGGDFKVFKSIEPLFQGLSGSAAYGFMGASGSGHYVKMIHNGVEYGMMQAIGEGIQILSAAPYHFDLAEVTRVWQNGSIVAGLLMDMMAQALKADPNLENLKGIVDASGEADWTIQEALDLKVSVPVLAHSLFTRYKSKDQEHMAEKAVAAMRKEFGGHAVVSSKEDV